MRKSSPAGLGFGTTGDGETGAGDVGASVGGTTGALVGAVPISPWNGVCSVYLLKFVL